MKKGIAFFDFDGTITSSDTLLEFIKYVHGTPKFLAGFLLNMPYLLAYKLQLISNQAAKEKVLAFFFKGMSSTAFQNQCDAFARDIIPALIRPAALKEIQQLQEKEFTVVIVSASPANWIKNWSASVNASLLATNLVVKDDKLTGKIQGNNCHGREKVRRINAAFQLTDYQEIYAYGDTSGDQPMLALAGHAFMKPFRS